MRLWNALPENIKKSARRNVFKKKKVHETLINMFKQENLYLTPSSILEIIDLVTGFDTILTSRQMREKLQCLYENLMPNNFRKTAPLKKI